MLTQLHPCSLRPLSSLSLSRSSRDKESLSLEPGHRSRKWFCATGGWSRPANKERKTEERDCGKEKERQRVHVSRSVLELQPVQVDSLPPPPPSLPVTTAAGRLRQVCCVCVPGTGGASASWAPARTWSLPR